MALTNSQYDAVMRAYEEIRERQAAARDAREREVRERIPSLAALDAEAADLAVAAVRSRHNKKEPADIYLKKLADLSKERRALLLAAGYPEDYRELRYDCPICRDTGFVSGRRCHCFPKVASDILRTRLGDLPVSDLISLADFSLDLYSDTIRGKDGLTAKEEAGLALAAAEDLLTFSEEGAPNLLIYGPAGVGKTHLAKGIAGDAIRSGRSVLYFTAPSLFDHLSGLAFGKGSSSEERQLLFDTDLIVIDDLGTELTNSFIRSELFRLLDGRLVRKKASVISTNLSPAELLDRYHERISSRINSSYQLIPLAGEDLRIKMKLQDN